MKWPRAMALNLTKMNNRKRNSFTFRKDIGPFHMADEKQ